MESKKHITNLKKNLQISEKNTVRALHCRNEWLQHRDSDAVLLHIICQFISKVKTMKFTTKFHSKKLESNCLIHLFKFRC